MGLLLYPNQPTVPNANTEPLSVNNCVNVAAAVSPQALGAAGSAQRVAIANSLTTATIQGARPTEDAYAYAVPGQVTPAMNSYGYFTPIIALVTDGSPTIAAGCEGAGQSAQPVNPQPIIQAISDAWTNYSIKTLVIGLPSSSVASASSTDPRAWMSQAASAGQTPATPDCSDSGIPNYCHVDLTNVTDPQSSITAALQSIVTSVSVLPCSFTIPPPTNGMIPDPTKISVVYNQNVVDGVPTAQFLIGQSNPDCSQGDGWYLDEATGAIDLCTKTCATIRQDPKADVELRQGCSIAGCGPCD